LRDLRAQGPPAYSERHLLPGAGMYRMTPDVIPVQLSYRPTACAQRMLRSSPRKGTKMAITAPRIGTGRGREIAYLFILYVLLTRDRQRKQRMLSARAFSRYAFGNRTRNALDQIDQRDRELRVVDSVRQAFLNCWRAQIMACTQEADDCFS